MLLEVDRISTPSELEREEIWNLTMGKTAHVLPPFFYDFRDLRTRGADHFAPLSDVVFVGGFPHSPNVDAALFIAREIMPLVWREVDRARLVLIGYAPPKEGCLLLAHGLWSPAMYPASNRTWTKRELIWPRFVLVRVSKAKWCNLCRWASRLSQPPLEPRASGSYPAATRSWRTGRKRLPRL